jgi:hypothetical protein
MDYVSDTPCGGDSGSIQAGALLEVSEKRFGGAIE